MSHPQKYQKEETYWREPNCASHPQRTARLVLPGLSKNVHHNLQVLCIKCASS